MILVIHAHPYPRNSRAGAALLEAIRDLPGLEVRSLYELYPDFDIDVAAERDALARARLVVPLHPLYWATMPGLLKHWMDEVLAWNGAAPPLQGKDCLWAVTSDEPAGGGAGLEEAARHCGMNWLEPFVLDGARAIDDDALRARARQLRERLIAHA